ncbi:type II secretion system protein [Bacillus solimangrovi]|uniref:Prepilin-type N-terminal cleavage/methylation domain-containing protein n=1 Tax=Bacillus solimangrovi TaxID=1305675 RepID=A0A1E5LDH2_9BACI|nr:type II secretion system protein [Bacillus solimangrovi]OEH92138.1 hypothetical protein BFG57_02370 [Bacillus solimangrovi]
MFEIFNKGFTLIEMLLVLAILSILISIVVIFSVDYIEKTEEEVCELNRRQLVNKYQSYLMLEGTEHSESTLKQYLQENVIDGCPINGKIDYTNKEIQCSVHTIINDDVENEEGVPIL